MSPECDEQMDVQDASPDSVSQAVALQGVLTEVLSTVNWQMPGAVEFLHAQLQEWTKFHREESCAGSDAGSQALTGKKNSVDSSRPSATLEGILVDLDVESMLDMVGSAHVPIIGTDMNGIVQIWNSKAEDISEYLKHEAIGENLVDCFIIDKFKDSVTEVLSEACQGRDTVNFEFTMQSKSKHFFNMLLNVGARRDSTGSIFGVIAIGHSAHQGNLTRINDMSGAEELANMIESGNAPIIGVNTAGTVTIWNQKAFQLTGYPKEEAIGKNLLSNFIEDQNKADVWQVLLHAFNGFATSNYEIVFNAKDGHQIDLVLNASPRHGSNNKIVGAVCIGQDVTFLQRATTEFGLFLWSMNDMSLKWEEMSQDAKKSLSIVAGLVHDGDTKSLEAAKCPEFCEWLKSQFEEGGESEFDFVEMFEVQTGTVWLRLVGRKHGVGCKGYVLDVTNEHFALLKAKQAEHYLGIMSRQAFDLVIHVDSKSFIISAILDAKSMTWSDLPQEGDDLRSLLDLDDAQCRLMTSAALMYGSSLQTVTFGEGAARMPSQCLCVIEPDDPGMMIVAITSDRFQARRRPHDKTLQKSKGLMKTDLQARSKMDRSHSGSKKGGSLSGHKLESLPEHSQAGTSEAWSESQSMSESQFSHSVESRHSHLDSRRVAKSSTGGHRKKHLEGGSSWRETNSELGNLKVKGTFLEFEFNDAERQGAACSRSSSAPTSNCGSSVHAYVPITQLAPGHMYHDRASHSGTSQCDESVSGTSQSATSQSGTSQQSGLSHKGRNSHRRSGSRPRNAYSASSGSQSSRPRTRSPTHPSDCALGRGGSSSGRHPSSTTSSAAWSQKSDSSSAQNNMTSSSTARDIAYLLRKWLTMPPDLHRLVDILEQIIPAHFQSPEVIEQLENVLSYIQQRLEEAEIPLLNAKFDRNLGERMRTLLPTSLVAPGKTEWEDSWHHMLLKLLFLALVDVADGKVEASTSKEKKKAYIATQVIQSSRMVTGCSDDEIFKQRVGTLISMADSKPSHVAAFLEDTMDKLLRQEA